MRVSSAKAAQNRRKILSAASRLFREHGIAATGVDAISEDAGLTHGAVYSQFGSKDAIAAAAVHDALIASGHLWRRMVEHRGRGHAFPAIVAQYLSKAHRDYAGRGCVVAALGSEIARQPRRVRDAFTYELKKLLKLMAGEMPRRERASAYDDAIATFVAMAGALMLARAVNDKTLSNRILKTAAASVIKRSRRKVLVS